MTYQTTPVFDRDILRRGPTPTVFILSVVFHIIVLVVIPIMSKLFQKTKRFERPKTFQLVSSPLRPNPARRVPVKEEARRQRMPQEKTKPLPRQMPDPKAPPRRKEAQKEKEAARPIDENLDELASILEEIPAPAQVAAVGNFKYHWYLNHVMGKLEQYWKPTTENRKIKVLVSFTIKQDGSITEPRITSSSGNGTLDNLAIRAVKLASPFGKLPPGFDGNELNLNCTLIPTRK